VEAHIVRAQVLAISGDPEVAVNSLDEALHRNSKAAELWIAKAALRNAQGDADGAMKVLEHAASETDNRVAVLLATIGFWARRDNEEGTNALLAFETDLAELSAHHQIQVLHGLASAHQAIGNLEHARRLWKRVASQKESDIQSRFQLFGLAQQQSDQAAMTDWIKEIRLIEGPRRPLGNYAEAVQLITTSRHDAKSLADARRLIDEAATQRPGWSRIYAVKGEIEDIEQKFEQAIDNYQKAIDLGDNNPFLVRRLIQLLSSSNRFQEANALLRSIESRGPLTTDLAKMASALSVKLNDPSRAVAKAREAVNSAPEDYANHLWLGHVLVVAGNQQEAGEHFQRAVELAKTEPTPWIAWVSYLAKTGQAERAEQAVDEARKNIAGDQVLFALAQCYEAIGKKEQAEQQYVAALQKRHNDLSVIQKVVAYYRRTGQRDKSRHYLETLFGPDVSKDVKQWARRTLAIDLTTNKRYPDFKKAIDLLEDNLRENPQSVADLRLKAVLQLTWGGNRDKAIKVFEEVDQQDRLTTSERFLLATAYQATGEFGKYYEQMLQVLGEDPKNISVVFHFARSLISAGRIGEAATWVRRLQELDPTGRSTIEAEARLMVGQKRDQEAAKLLLEKGRQDPATAEATAALLEQLRLWEPAEALHRELASKTDRPENQCRLAGYLGRRGKTQEALDILERAVGQCPLELIAETAMQVLTLSDGGNAIGDRVIGLLKSFAQKEPSGATSYKIQIGTVYALQKRYADAVAIYEEILLTKPGEPLALNNLAWLYAVCLNRGEDALNTINLAIKAHGPVPELLDTRSSAYMSLGRRKEALEDLERALKESPSAGKYCHLALIHFNDKNEPEAKNALQKAYEFGLDLRTFHPHDREVYSKLIANLGGESPSIQ
jgi:tetratricopeptide (TPR) repeat protein